MKKFTSSQQPLIILLLTLLLTVSFSFLPKESTIFGLELKYIDMLIDIKQYEEPVIPSSSLNNAAEMKASIIDVDAFAKLISDFISKEKLNEAINTLPAYLYGDLGQLSFFFDALKSVKTRGIRIAHYGDSAIEGDLISAEFRESLQSKYGGNSVGHLGIVSQDITFRTTTKHSFSPANTWEVASLYGPNPKNLPVGISGEIVIPKGNAWVKYEITRSQRSLKEFNSIRIFYTNAKASAIKVYFNESTTPKVVNLVAGADLKELLVKCDAPSKSVKIEFPLADQAYFYGVSLENPVGLYVDNFPLRGNSGVDILKILPNTLKDYAKFVDYKLIVLEFGLNLAGKTDYSWYEREMGRVIGHLKTAYPKASILMISVHDKAVKQGSNFVTDPSVLRLLETQKNIATKNNVALFNLFEAMGGNNSMGKWVTANPPLASKDYVHFNIYGAKRVADMITQSLLDEFNKRK